MSFLPSSLLLPSDAPMLKLDSLVCPFWQVEEWQTKCKALAKQQEEEKAAAAHKHQEEVDFLEEQGEGRADGTTIAATCAICPIAYQ